ncbi:MAG: DUF4160 domain-containing protein [Gemmatimonadota bacterium]|nr:DUF4160 domain-containing protein [Gemmatimonadota bacterium]
MPTIRDITGPYRFFFFSFDCNEPKHVHVQREKRICKFWLEPISLCKNQGFSPHELNRIRRAIRANVFLILENWDEHCGKFRTENSACPGY